jgi:hypothetical protein
MEANCEYRLFGFFLGSTLTGAGVYYYVLEEYRVANELLTEDIYVRPLPLPYPSSDYGICAAACGNRRGLWSVWTSG